MKIKLGLSNSIRVGSLGISKGSVAAAVAPPSIVTNGLVAKYKHDDGSGTTLTDSSGNGKNGTLGTTTEAPSWVSTGLSYDGGDNVSITGLDDALFLGANGFTAIIVQKVQNTAGEKFVEFMSDNSGADGIKIPIELRTNNSVPSYIALTRAHDTAGLAWRAGHYSLNSWAMYAVVAPQAIEGAGSFYINAARYGVNPASANVAHANGTGATGTATGRAKPLRFGTREDGVVKLIGGTAYAVFYNRQLTQAEVEQNYLAIRSELSSRGITLPSMTNVIAFDGDSQTWGTGIAAEGTDYPAQCIATLGNTYQYINNGVTGQQLGSGGANTINGDAPTYVDPAVSSGFTGKKICVLWGGSNDIDAGVAAATVQGYIESYVSARKAAGFTHVVVLTMLDRAAFTAGERTAKNTCNGTIRSRAATVGYTVADVAADGRIGDDGDYSDTTYFNADQVHLNGTGYGVVAGIVATAIQGL